MRKLIPLFALLSLAAIVARPAFTEDKPKEEDRGFSVAEGKLTFKAPAGWVRKKPKSNIIEMEYEIPAAKGNEIAGRLTIMGAGGKIDANVERWYGQFEQPDGSNTKDKAKLTKMTVAGQNVHFVDVAGTYKDSPSGPFAGGKTVLRENYRMLAAIIETKEAGNYFLKFYGPKETVGENEKAFKELVESLVVKK